MTMELLQVTMVTSRVCTESPWLDNNIIGYLTKPHKYHCGNWLYMYLLFSYSRLVEELIWRSTTKPLSLQVFLFLVALQSVHTVIFLV